MGASPAGKIAALLVGHGSRRKGFQTAMEKVARDLRLEGSFDAVVCAYLEIARPSIPAAVETLAARGVSEIRLVPYFVQLGKHVQEDIPAIVEWANEKFAGRTRVVLCPYLGYDESLAALVSKRLSEKS
jgi:sirohydrochlorin ferrochelatase